MYFFIAALVFLNMATLKKHRILRCESYFSVSCVFMFFLNKIEEMTPKFKKQFVSQKFIHEWRPGSPAGSKIVPNSRERGPKNPKIAGIAGIST